jgi:hypothetical protein
MKLIALFAIAFLVSCASSPTDVIDERFLDCSPGQDISIMAGFDQPVGGENVDIDDRFDLLVQVSNNSHGEVTVATIRAEQSHTDSARYRIQSSFRRFDQVVEEGKDHTFHLPMTGRMVAGDPRMRELGRSSGGLQMVVTVALSNGDSYRCSFEMSGR